MGSNVGASPTHPHRRSARHTVLARLQRAQPVLQLANGARSLRQRGAQLARLALERRHAVVQQAALTGGGLQALRQAARLALLLRGARVGGSSAGAVQGQAGGC